MLPEPDANAKAHSSQLSQLIAEEIRAAGGSISFERYMHLALYSPGLGYYSGPLQKFGEAGDFVTAPGLGRLFGRCVARAIAPVLDTMAQPAVTEFGAGDGALAQSILDELAVLGLPKVDYTIIETAADLIARQQETLGLASVVWRDTLPDTLRGVVLGNELIDAMPCSLFEIAADGAPMAVDVRVAGEEGDTAADTPVFESCVSDREIPGPRLPDNMVLAPGYRSEISDRGAAWVRSIGERLAEGVILLVDYGFPAAEYYHPDRRGGTLMCHYRHHSHADPFWWPGLQDITCHVDFSAIARAAMDVGLSVAGYTDQANFLIDSGLTDILAATQRSHPPGSPESFALSAEVKKLTMPHEMGELFKVIALASRLPAPIRGFTRSNRAARLV